jgi:hypothetical protein
MAPQSLPEWEQYVQTLAGSALRSKAIAVNSQQFMDMMRIQEGFSVVDVRQIILYFVRQLVATGQKIPEGGAYDMLRLARTDDVARTMPVLSEQAVQDMIARQVPEEALD